MAGFFFVGLVGVAFFVVTLLARYLMDTVWRPGGDRVAARGS